MRFTIERIRTLVLATGVLLVVVLAGFLAVGRWKSPFNRRDIPKRLGIDIQQEANGVTYTQAHGGHTIFKMHASKVVQLKNDHATLHDVKIELYGPDGAVDRIQGNEFEYDQKSEIASAVGPVEITLTRPQSSGGAGQKKKASGSASDIDVKTSGLLFNQQTGIASTDQHVDFSSAQGSGSAMGATYNSDQGLLVLDHDVELTTSQDANPVELHARHAEINRNTQLTRLQGATARTRGQHASAALALISFRHDGSIESLDASGGVTLATAAGSHLAAPRGTMQFDQDNHPRGGRFEGGVIMDSSANSRTMSGAAPVMTLAFNAAGELSHAHLQGDSKDHVELRSQEQAQSTLNGRAVPVEMTRTWRSSIADVDFRGVGKNQRKEQGKGQGENQVEPAQVRGAGNVVLTSSTRRDNQAAVPSRISADEVTGIFGPHSTLTSMTGIGHAGIEETTATGARQVATGDQIQARFAPAPPESVTSKSTAAASAEAARIQSADLEGHVTLFQQPATKPGASPASAMHATAGRAVYEDAGQWLHLTLNPRIEDAGMELTAAKIDFSQQSGDAFAHGDVKATWIDMDQPGASSTSGAAAVTLGGKGPAHAIAAEVEFHQPTGEATFRGHARLWQEANSIAAPLIVIDREKQTLVAKTSNPSEPVVAVLLQSGPGNGAPANSGPATSAATSAPRHGNEPSLVRVRGGDLWYSGKDRKAVMRARPLSAVTAQSQGVESNSEQVELFLAAPGAARQSASAPAQVESMKASGHVILTSEDRRGTGEKLIYTGATDNYVLTGTASAPPRFTDPGRGTVTGSALIFNSRDDSVSIEGGGHQTITDTTGH